MALVLCTGIEPAVMTTRRLILERAGHTVVLAANDRQVEKACQSHGFHVAVIGQNTSAAVKHRYFRIIREHCASAKVLELHRPFSDKCLEAADAWLPMPGDDPDELARTVNELSQK